MRSPHERRFPIALAALLAVGAAVGGVGLGILKAVALDVGSGPLGRDVWITEAELPRGATHFTFLRDFWDWQARCTAFARLSAYRIVPETVGGGVGQATVAEVTPHLLATLGLSRWDREPARGEVLLGSHFALSRLRRSRAALGSHIAVGGRLYEVAGILPPRFSLPDATPDIFARIHRNPAPGSGLATVKVVGTLAPGQNLADAAAQLAAVERQLAAIHPELRALVAIRLLPLAARLRAPIARDLWFALLVALATLVIVGTNPAGLTAAVAIRQRRGRVLRVMLGAGRARLWSETAQRLAVPGCWALPAALLLLYWLRPIPAALLAHFGGQTYSLAFAAGAGAALLVALLAGMAVVFEAFVASGPAALAPARPGQSLAPMAWLIGIQVACLVVAAYAGGVETIAYINSRYRGLGFRPGHVYETVLRLNGPSGGPADPVSAEDEVLATLESSPGAARGVGLSESVPPAAPLSSIAVTVRGAGRARPGPLIAWQHVAPGYFAALKIPLLRGRLPNSADRAQSRPVALVNRRFAEQYLGGVATGGELRLGGPLSPWLAIIGVVADSRNAGPAAPAQPEVDVPYWQAPFSGAPIIVWLRTPLAAAGAAAELRRAVGSVAPRLGHTILPVRLTEHLDRVTQGRRTVAESALMLAAFAWALASLGVFSLALIRMESQRHDLALRLALGGGVTEVLRAAGAPLWLPVACGLSVGGLASAALLIRWAPSLPGPSPAASNAVLAGAVGLALASIAAGMLRPVAVCTRMRLADLLRGS